jgi:hypothetical protein
MGIRDTDRTLASNRMIFDVRRDRARYRRFRGDLEGLMAEYRLTEEERRAWRAGDIKRLAVLASDCVASHTAELHEATLKNVAFLFGDVLPRARIAGIWQAHRRAA